MAFACLHEPVTAGDANKNAGTSSFSFLKIDIGSRAVAMGGAYTGLANDEEALYYNPAGLVTMEGKRFIAGYHNYFIDLQSGFLGYIHPLGENRAFALSSSYLSFGTFTQTDLQGNVEGEFSGGDLFFAGSFAQRYNRAFSFGGTLKFLYEKIQEYSATGVAADLGVRYSSDRDRYGAGLMIQNIGSQLSSLGSKKDGLPTSIRLGGSMKPRGVPVLFAADIILPTDNDPVFAVGIEYFEQNPFFIRAGWNSYGSNFRARDSEDKLAGFALGFGFNYKKNLKFGYAFMPGADLGDSHRITLSGRL